MSIGVPSFKEVCQSILDSIQTLIPNNNNIDINIDLLLHGNRSFSYDLNTEIFQAVHKFIIDTHRFIQINKKWLLSSNETL
jgi:hypothetical protein